jgi:hypothetical protein
MAPSVHALSLRAWCCEAAASAASDRALRNLIALARANTHFAHAAAPTPFLHTCKCNGPIIFGARLDTAGNERPTYLFSLSSMADQYLRSIGCIYECVRLSVADGTHRKSVELKMSRQTSLLKRKLHTGWNRGLGARRAKTYTAIGLGLFLFETQSAAVFAALLGISLIWRFE